MSDDDQEIYENLKNGLKNCSFRIEEESKEQLEYLLKLGNNEWCQQLLLQYIKSKTHDVNCHCEIFSIGSLFANYMKHKKLESWPILHFIANNTAGLVKKQLINELLKLDSSLISSKTLNGLTPLMVACQSNANIASYFLTFNEFKLTLGATDTKGKTALTYSFKNSNRVVSDKKIDITTNLVMELTDIKFEDIIDSLEESECPPNIIISLPQKLNENNTPTNSDIFRVILLSLKRTDFSKETIINLFKWIINKHRNFLECLTMLEVTPNILEAIANNQKTPFVSPSLKFFLNSTDFTNESLLWKLGKSDCRNILHYAFRAGDMDNVISIISSLDDHQLNSLLNQTDVELKKPIYYCRKPLQLIRRSNRQLDVTVFMDLNLKAKENILSKIVRESFRSDFEVFIQLCAEYPSLLKNCDA